MVNGVIRFSSIVIDGPQSMGNCHHGPNLWKVMGRDPEQTQLLRERKEGVSKKGSLIGEIIFYASVSKYGNSRRSGDPSPVIVKVLLCCNKK